MIQPVKYTLRWNDFSLLSIGNISPLNHNKANSYNKNTLS